MFLRTAPWSFVYTVLIDPSVRYSFLYRFVLQLPGHGLNFFDAVFRGWEIFGHGSSQIGDGLSNLATDLEMNLVGLLLSLDVIAAQLFFGLCSAEQVSCQFSRAHVIKNLLALLQTFSLVNGFLIQSSIKALLAMILEDCEVQPRLNSCLLGHLDKLLVVLSQLIAQ